MVSVTVRKSVEIFTQDKALNVGSVVLCNSAMVKKYKLKVLAVTLDNGYLTDFARESIKNIIKVIFK